MIDNCDYYLLIVAARYGSLAPDGISYTEKEYDYAIEQGKKVIAFIHKNPGSLPIDKSDQDNERSLKLNEFRDKVSRSRLVEHWEDAKDLLGIVAVSVPYAITRFPAAGWVRGDIVANEEILVENRKLRNENINLKEQIADLLAKSNSWKIDNLADISSTVSLNGKIIKGERNGINLSFSDSSPVLKEYSYSCTWLELFLIIAKELRLEPRDFEVRYKIEKEVSKKINITDCKYVMVGNTFEKIMLQLEACCLVDVFPYHGRPCWKLTSKGKELMFQYYAVKDDIHSTISVSTVVNE